MKMTTLCYIEKDGCYLMLHRTKKEKDINKGKWIGVGGHAYDGETPEECLLREVKEETGLTFGNISNIAIIQIQIMLIFRVHDLIPKPESLFFNCREQFLLYILIQLYSATIPFFHRG